MIVFAQHKLKEVIPYSGEAHMKPAFLWLFTATVTTNIQAFIYSRNSLTSVTSMMSAAEQGGLQPQADVVPSAGGGRSPGRDAHGGGSQGHGRGGHGSQNNNNNNQACFIGRESQLNGFILDYTVECNPDQYIHFKDELVNFFGRNLTKYTDKFTTAIEETTLDDPVAPPNPDPANMLDLELWKLNRKEHEEKVRAWREFHSQLYHVVLGQCTLSLQEEICAHADHEAAINNGIELLQIIHSILHSVNGTGQSNLADSYCEIKKMWFAMKQGCSQSVQKWHDCVCNGVNILKDLNIKVADEAIVSQVTAANR